MVQEPPVIDPAKFTARKPKVVPITENRQLQKLPREQQTRAGLSFKVWDGTKEIQAPQAMNPPTAPTRGPQASAPMQQIDISAPLPPDPDNLFAQLNRGSASLVIPPAQSQAAPAMHEPARTPIRKCDTDTKRYLRRCGHREYMIKRHTAIRNQYGRFCRGGGKIRAADPGVDRALNVARGLKEMTTGGFGMTKETLGLVFNDWGDAINILRRYNPKSGLVPNDLGTWANIRAAVARFQTDDDVQISG